MVFCCYIKTILNYQHKGENYPISPSSYWMMLNAVIGAVSVRRILGPRDTDIKPFWTAILTSSFENPPSGPMSRTISVVSLKSFRVFLRFCSFSSSERIMPWAASCPSKKNHYPRLWPVEKRGRIGLCYLYLRPWREWIGGSFSFETPGRHVAPEPSWSRLWAGSYGMEQGDVWPTTTTSGQALSPQDRFSGILHGQNWQKTMSVTAFFHTWKAGLESLKMCLTTTWCLRGNKAG